MQRKRKQSTNSTRKSTKKILKNNMVSKWTVILIIVLSATIGFSVFAIASSGGNNGNSNLKADLYNNSNKKAQDVLSLDQMKEKEKAIDKEELKYNAEKYSIDTKDLTDEQIQIEVDAKELDENKSKAEGLGIDVTGLSGKEIKDKVKEKEDGIKINKANKAGINTDGLTSEQLNILISEKDNEENIKKGTPEKMVILEMAQQNGIDIKGLTYGQLKEKVREKLLPELTEKAKKFGVKSKNLSYEDLLKKVKEKEIELIISGSKEK